MGRRERRRQERKDEMLTKAMEIVERGGLDALTIARLAKALDAAVGALYRYFPSKDALLLGLQQQALESFVEELEEEWARVEDEVEGQAASIALLRVLWTMQFYLGDARRAPSRHRLIYAFMSSYSPVLADEAAQEVAGVVGQILGGVQEALRGAGVVDGREREQLTYVLWAALQGLDHFRKRDRLQPVHLRVDALLGVAQRLTFRGAGIAPNVIEEAFALFARLHAAQNTHEGIEHQERGAA